MDPVLTAGAAAAAILAVMTLAGLAWRGSRRAARIADAILGAPAQDGLPERPGVVRQLELLHHEVAGLAGRVDAHLSWHAGHDPALNGGYRPRITDHP